MRHGESEQDKEDEQDKESEQDRESEKDLVTRPRVWFVVVVIVVRSTSSSSRLDHSSSMLPVVLSRLHLGASPQPTMSSDLSQTMSSSGGVS